MKTSDMKDAALNWAVAKCEGAVGANDRLPWYCPSTNWEQGGPIIEREGITIARRGKHSWSEWGAVLNDFEFDEEGTTPLIAAMRCFVASKLGDNIDIPKELT